MIEKTIKKALFKESKLPVIQNIKKAISEKKFNEKVEENDIILNIKEKQKIVKKVEKKRNSLIYPVKNTVVNSVLNKLIKKVKILDEIEIEYNGKKEEMKKAFANQLLSLNGFENPPVIKSVDIDTKGIEYNTPEYIKAFNIEEYLADKYKQDNKTQIRRGNIK